MKKGLLKRLYIEISILIAKPYKRAELYRKYFGIKIGNGTSFFGRHNPFSSEYYLIEIGKNVTVGIGVVLLTHDGGARLFREEFPGINVFGKVIIGDNVFVGHEVIIMPGVTIGNNVIIGARSVVTKDIPSNVVAAGIPARVVKSFNDYKEGVLNRATYVNEVDPMKRKKIILEAFTNN